MTADGTIKINTESENPLDCLNELANRFDSEEKVEKSKSLSASEGVSSEEIPSDLDNMFGSAPEQTEEEARQAASYATQSIGIHH
jgi:hypothetical protein